MRFVTTHLTRMAPGYICVAGVDIDTGEQVRPVIRGRLPYDRSGCMNGPFDIGHVVDIGSVWNVGQAPELEDREFSLGSVVPQGCVAPETFWKVLNSTTHRTLGAAFGPELQPWGQSRTVGVGRGTASLAIIKPRRVPELIVTRYEKLRLAVETSDFQGTLPVTDLRLYDSFYEINMDAVARTRNLLAKTKGVLIGVGLTRPWQRPGDHEPRHWLQVNNLHFVEEPLWLSSSHAPRIAQVAIPFLEPVPKPWPQHVPTSPASPDGAVSTTESAREGAPGQKSRLPDWVRSMLRLR